MNTLQKPQRLGWGNGNGNGNSFSNLHYNRKSPVYRSDGKIVGYILHGILVKKVSSEKHMLQKPKGWAWDEEILMQAENEGASQIEIQDRNSGRTYHASIKDFWDYGIGFNRGWGDQIVLPLNYWEIQAPGETRARQLALKV